MLSVKIFGEVEYWLTIVKVITVVVFILTGFALIFGLLGDKAHGLSTFVANGKGEGFSLLALFAILSTAAFSFGGTEAVVVTAGESDKPEKTMPKAVNQVFWRILIFYVATMFIISSVISITDERLIGGKGVTASPFTLVLEQAGLGVAAALMNAVIVSSVFSAGNSAIYYSSRQMYSLAERGYAPKTFAKLNKKSSPQLAVVASIVIIALSFLFEHFNKDGYYMLLSLVGVLVVCVWMIAVYTQIRLRKAIAAQNKEVSEVLPYQAKFGVVGSYIALVAFVALIVFQTYADFTSGGMAKAIYDILPPVILLGIYFGHKLTRKTKTVKLTDIDLSKHKE